MKVGDKIKGFKFRTKLELSYNEYMDNYIDKIGKIGKINNETIRIDFENDYFFYPKKQAEKHLVKEENETKKDSIVQSVINQFNERSKRGIEKYGTTLQENNNDDFLQHLKEELMDAILYIEKLQTLKNEQFNR